MLRLLQYTQVPTLLWLLLLLLVLLLLVLLLRLYRVVAALLGGKPLTGSFVVSL